MTDRNSRSQIKDRTQAQRQLVKDALDRPGIREVMRVYEDWRHLDHDLEPYRTATREPQKITATDRANQQ